MYYAAYQPVEVPETKEMVGTGWLPPLPDFRDYSEKHHKVIEMVKKLRISPTKTPTLPAQVDLRPSFASIAIESQGNLGSCTACAAVGVVEYCERIAFARHIEGSRLFVYKTTRNLLGWVGDTGAWMRTTMGALVLCGIPPEKYWQYTTNRHPGPERERTFDEEPPAFIYALADNYEAVKYFRHDLPDRTPDQVLSRIKLYLLAQIPSMFGFYGFESYRDTDTLGAFPHPCPGDEAVWGHAVVAVGYDDNKKIKNTKCNIETKGALLIRNSWGTDWGESGYGWLPYDYVLNRWTQDFWSLISMEWVDTKQFGLEK